MSIIVIVPAKSFVFLVEREALLGKKHLALRAACGVLPHFVSVVEPSFLLIEGSNPFDANL